MSSPVASSPNKGLLGHWWRNLKPHDTNRPPLLSTHSSSAVMRATAEPSEVWVINDGKRVAVPTKYVDSPIFGVPLDASIKYASVTISLSDSSGQEFAYGHVPVVVAKCSSFLKQNGQTVRGIFRLSGSIRRINVLQSLFNKAPKFGKDVDWDGFTVHDAANILRRYFNQLPEPIVPHAFYEAFRAPLLNSKLVLDHLEYKAELIKTNVESDKELIKEVPAPPQETVEALIDEYECLLFKLPPVNLHLLVYLLDLMDVFESKSEENLMPAFNLATIFLMSILTFPGQNDLESQEYQLSRLVLVFLIENSSKILLRVWKIAVQEHDLRKQSRQSMQLDPENAAQPTQSNSVAQVTPTPSASNSVSASNEGSSLSVERTSQVPMLVVADVQNDPIYVSGRQHSKSMSSAAPPAQIRSHRDSLLSNLRRQISSSKRRDVSGTLSTGSNTSLNTTASPSSMGSDENNRRRSWLLRKR